ncbi:MAG: TIGR01777 family protein [Thermoflavifilum aggregans]|nr:TIGR01777 family protein [Thermoflavifilum aggregans]
MPTVLMTGGTGLIGQSLVNILQQRGYHIKLLTRSMRRDHPGVQYLLWNPQRKELPVTDLLDADYLIHLAGANIAEKRWTAARKQELLLSRTHTLDLLFDVFSHHPHQLKALISASAIGYYDASQDRWFEETDAPGHDFLAKICLEWEAHASRFEALSVRVVMLRTGIVLSRQGGFLAPFLKALRWGVVPILGSGTQWISWIHIHDLCRLYANALITGQMKGPYNAVAPEPVTQKDLMLTLARMLKKQYFVPFHVPAFMLRLLLGEMSTEVLKSVRVSAQKLQREGFQYSFPDIHSALSELLHA